MQEKFFEIEKNIRSLAAARLEFKQAISKLDAGRKDFNEDYVRSHIDPQKRAAQNGIKTLEQSTYEKVNGLLREIESLAIEKAKTLDLSNPAWVNALGIISAAGSAIEADTVNAINKQFATDQAALRALRKIYQAKGIMYNGNLDTQIYEPEPVFENLRNWSLSTIIQDAPLNSFVGKISKIAALEGIEFPRTLDEPATAAASAARQAAGLRVN